MLIAGSILLVIIGFIHSILGEKYILIRLFRRENLPHLMGSDWFTKQTLRFAWHITTLAWWGFAAILYILATPDSTPVASNQQTVLHIIALVFAISGLVSLVFSRGKHLSWVFFFVIAYACFSGVIN
jgi:peptidoglycan/LPS O-acetylase OafA/YrhL